MLCALILYVSGGTYSPRESGCWKQRSIDRSGVLRVIFPERTYELSEKAIEYFVSEAMFLPGIGGVHQRQTGILIFTDRITVGRGTGARVFCRELGFELHFMLKNNCSVFQTEIFAILKAVEAIAGGPASDSDLR